MNYLGLDYGEKHTGVSLATGPLAEPLTTIPTSRLLTTLSPLVTKFEIHAIVLGVPKDKADPSVSQLIADLAPLNLPVYLMDETLSSVDARKALLHTTQSRRRQLEHAVAATLILQSWLDSQTNL